MLAQLVQELFSESFVNETCICVAHVEIGMKLQRGKFCTLKIAFIWTRLHPGVYLHPGVNGFAPPRDLVQIFAQIHPGVNFAPPKTAFI